MQNTHSSLLLGQDYGVYGSVEAVQVGSRSAAAISVGSDEASPSHRFKYDPNVKNEDAICVVESANLLAFAVADAHFGPESSHVLIAQLHTLFTKEIPRTATALMGVVKSAGESQLCGTHSETTLLAVVHDSATNRGYGVSVGDSTVMAIKVDGSTQVLNSLNQEYVSASNISTSGGLNGFEFETKITDLLLGFTDGVNECNYRKPETSIRNSDISDLVTTASFNTLKVVDQLATLALTGVRSNPGGQDNVAIVAVSV